MAAITSTGTGGNWSATGTWVGGVVPGSGDTVTIAGNVTVDVDTTVGSSPLTGGTAAITFGTGAAVTLTVAAGKALTVLGPIAMTSPGFATTSQTVLAAGASLVIRPASGQQYTWSFAQQSQLVCNGSSGARCTVRTDLSLGGLPAYMAGDGGYRTQGLVTASFTDFGDFGDTSHFGVLIQPDYPGDTSVPISVTSNTFTACSMQVTDGGSAWDGNITFNDNVMSSSVASNGNGAGLLVSLQTVPVNGTRTFAGNTIDLLAQLQYCPGVNWSYSVFLGKFLIAGVPGAPFSMDNCLVRMTTASGITGGTPTGGGFTSSYVLIDEPAALNPHAIAGPVYTGSGTFNYTNNIFEFNGTDTTGNMILAGAAAGQTYIYTGNLILPNAGGGTSGAFTTSADVSGVSLTYDHNTACVKGQWGVEMGESQTAVESPNRWASVRSNVFFAGSAGANYAVTNTSGSTLVDMIPIAVLDYNGRFNVAATDGSFTYANQGNGYISAWSATPGTHDVVGDPGFVDATRNLLTWGRTQAGLGGSATYADVLAYLGAAPRTRIPAAMTWIRAGFAPTNPALHDTAHDGTDIGAVAYQALATFLPAWAVRSSNQTLGCGVY